MNKIADKIAALTRSNIRALKPYSSARDESSKQLLEPVSGFPSNGRQRIMLDANENSFGGPLEEDFSRYPDPQQRSLKHALANLKGLDPEQIFIGNGSDEAIDLLFRVFVEPGRDNVVIMPPTYGMYTVQADIHGAKIYHAPLRSDFSPDAELVLSVTDEFSKLLFLCSPNNPTGQSLPEDFVLDMLSSFPGVVVVDEAYADFSEKPGWALRLHEFPNLVVLQTLSKAWGLAGLRIGMAFSNPFVINLLNKIKYPYNLSAITMRLAIEAISKHEEVVQKTANILLERHRLEHELPRISCVEKVYPSDANFLLVRVVDAEDVYQYLAENGIIVRNRSREPNCQNCLRITVGTETENERLLQVLAEYPKKNP